MKFFQRIPGTFKRTPLILAFICAGMNFLCGQSTSTSSPYSRFGIGALENTGFSEITAMGGAYTAMQNDSLPFIINQGNPASYPFNRDVIFSMGARYSFSNFTDNQNGTVKAQNGGFNYISLAFPIGKKKLIGAAFGLAPFTSIGYQATTYDQVDSIGQVTNNYRGSGGINQLYGGVGFRPIQWGLKNSLLDTLQKLGRYRSIRRKRFLRNTLSSWSLGANVSFMYGNINYATRKYFPAQLGAVFNTLDYTETEMKDIYYQLGSQISFQIDSVGRKGLKNKIKITLGYSISLPKNMQAYATHVSCNFSLGSYNNEIPFDTFSYQPNFSGKIFLPLMHSAGFGLKIGKSLNIFGDAGFQQWSKFTFLGQNQQLSDQYRFSFGGQILPNRQAIGRSTFFKRVSYRFGARYNTGYINLNGYKIDDRAISAGLGLPVGLPSNRTTFKPTVNITAEYGMGGTVMNQLVAVRYFRIIIGFTICDSGWFWKRRYD